MVEGRARPRQSVTRPDPGPEPSRSFRSPGLGRGPRACRHRMQGSCRLPGPREASGSARDYQGVRIYRYWPGPEARRSFAYLAEYLITILCRCRHHLENPPARRCPGCGSARCDPRTCLFLVGLPLVALGSCLIYDHHDACPELMIAKGQRDGCWQVRLMRLFERLTYRYCDVSVETNESYREYRPRTWRDVA